MVSSSPRFGHQRGLVGLNLAGDSDDLGVAGHLQVELDGDRLAEDAQVAVGDMAAVLAEVQRDAVGPPISARAAAQTGSGSYVRRACRTVAT